MFDHRGTVACAVILSGLAGMFCLACAARENPMRVEATCVSPTNRWVAEVLSIDVGWLTDRKDDRGLFVYVRKPTETRDPVQIVVHALGPGMPHVKWLSDSELEVSVPQGTTVTKSTKHTLGGVEVNIRDK